MVTVLNVKAFGWWMDVYPVSCFHLNKKAPIRGAVDRASHRVEDGRVTECKGATDTFRMKEFDRETQEKFETKSVMLHFDLEYLPDTVCLDHVSYPVRQFVPKTHQCKSCWKFGQSLFVCRRDSETW